MKEIFGDNEFLAAAKGRMELIKDISEHITVIKAKVGEMTESRRRANQILIPRERAVQYATMVLPFLEEIRYHIDKLEEIVDNEMWPLPKYREMLFSR